MATEMTNFAATLFLIKKRLSSAEVFTSVVFAATTIANKLYKVANNYLWANVKFRMKWLLQQLFPVSFNNLSSEYKYIYQE